MTENTPHRLAVAVYELLLDFDGEVLNVIDRRVMAAMVAATWAAVERGAELPWKAGPRLPLPTMTRERFMTFAGETFDIWLASRPGSHLTLIAGNRTAMGPRQVEDPTRRTGRILSVSAPVVVQT